MFGLSLPTPANASPGAPTVPSGILYYVPVTLSNFESTPTLTPFQQVIQVDSYTYFLYEAPNLQNVEFFSSSGTIIPSWLESGNSNTATSTTYWLRLPTGIPAGSNITVYMGFDKTTVNLFNAQTTGEAPELSPAYGEYDSGNSVFNFYDGFAGNSLGSGWIAGVSSQPDASVRVQNGLNLSLTANGAYAGIVSTVGISSVNFLEGAVSVLSNNNYIRFGIGESLGDYLGSTGLYAFSQEVTYGQSLGFAAGSFTSGFVFGHDTNFMINFGINGIHWQNAQNVTLEETKCWSSCNDENYYTENATAFFGASIPSPTTVYPTLGMTNSGYASQAGLYWVRARAFPPNGVMPTMSFGYPVRNEWFTLSASPAVATLALTGNGTFGINVASHNGFNQPVRLSVVAPTGIACRFKGQLHYGQSCAVNLTTFPGTVALYLYTSSSTSVSRSIKVPVTGSSPGYPTKVTAITLNVKPLTGVRSLVTVKSFGVVKSGGTCLSSVSTRTSGNCFSIQQNFFVNVPGMPNKPAYWVQNVVVIQKTGAGSLVDFSEWNIFKISGTSINLVSCRGWVQSDKCRFLSLPVPLVLPKTFNLTSSIVGSNLNLYLNGAKMESFSLGTSGAYISGLCSDHWVCPSIHVGSLGYEPQLVVVGEANSYQVEFGPGTSFVMKQLIKLGSPAWSSNIVESQVTYGLGPGESSQHLIWTRTSSNQASLDYHAQWSDQGTAFVPR
jgi:hypothetical protein